jgi:hypothetical protein
MMKSILLISLARISTVHTIFGEDYDFGCTLFFQQHLPYVVELCTSVFLHWDLMRLRFLH